MIKGIKDSVSFYAAVVITLVIAYFHYSMPKWGMDFYTNELGWDILSYYLYLPLTFIYHDIGIKDFSIIEKIFAQYEPSGTFYQAFQLESGLYVMNYTVGFAILFSPFFFIGHAWALMSGYAADGFSFPYQFSIATGVFLYILAGIFLIRRVLLKFFSDKVSAVVLLFMILGTNHFHEAVHDYMMPHGMLYSLYAIFIYLVIKWHEHPKAKTAFFLGLTFGMMFLCRQSEILAALVFVLWGVYNKETFLAKLDLLVKNISSILWIIVAGLIVVAPQMIYWKTVTGSWIFFSMERTEGFNLLAPHIWESLFSFKNSWFIYTPMIIFAWIGMISLYKRKKEIFYPIFLFAIINFYLLSSWLAWWNGGGFGMRYFVESYVLMAIPFGYFIQSLFERKKILQFFVLSLMVLFMTLNIFQSYQYAQLAMPHDGKNFEFYKANFFKLKPDPETWKLLDFQRRHVENEEFINQEDYEQRTIGYFNFENINSAPLIESQLDSTIYLSPGNSYRLDKEMQYSPAFKIPFNALTKREHAWVRVTLNYYPMYDLQEAPASLVIHMSYKGRNFVYRGYDLEKRPYKVGEWNTITVEYITPYPFSFTEEQLYVYVWNRSDKPFYIDDMHIEAFERKW